MEVFLQVVKHTLNPVWSKFSIPVRSLCNGDYDRNIKVTCYDHESDGDHNLIGEFYVTLRQLTQGPSPSNVFQCINPEKKVGTPETVVTLYCSHSYFITHLCLQSGSMLLAPKPTIGHILNHFSLIHTHTICVPMIQPISVWLCYKRLRSGGKWVEPLGIVEKSLLPYYDTDWFSPRNVCVCFIVMSGIEP